MVFGAGCRAFPGMPGFLPWDTYIVVSPSRPRYECRPYARAVLPWRVLDRQGWAMALWRGAGEGLWIQGAGALIPCSTLNDRGKIGYHSPHPVPTYPSNRGSFTLPQTTAPTAF